VAQIAKGNAVQWRSVIQGECNCSNPARLIAAIITPS
jgi:hypothetical protein